MCTGMKTCRIANLAMRFCSGKIRPVISDLSGARKLTDLTMTDQVAGVDVDGPRKQGWTLSTDHKEPHKVYIRFCTVQCVINKTQ